MTANYPTRITREQLDQCSHRDMLVVLFTDDASSSTTPRNR